MGDFNITEEAIDRAPARTDNESATDVLRELRHKFNIQDTWRKTHPTSRLFTFYSNNNTYSCLDRIYTSPTHEKHTHDWESKTSAIPTDHRMISVRYAPANIPYIGKGCWSWPIGLLNDKN